MTPAHTENASDSTFSTTNQNKRITPFSFDTVIVFGEGPVRPVLLENELTSQQMSLWNAYKADPFRNPEPDFWFMQQHKYLSQLQKIQERANLTNEEKALFIELKRQEWQRIGWFAMKTMGRQNALAAGYALYKGFTKRIILSGGPTIAPWVKKIVSLQRLASWPSEAEMMQDIVVSHYGELYEKKYGRSIFEAICLEKKATNTLENFSCTINKYPEVLSDTTKVGFLSAGYHLERLKMLAHIFSLHCSEGGDLSAQELLEEAMRQDQTLNDNASYVPGVDAIFKATGADRLEQRWKKGLEDPKYLTYWLGYVGEVKYPKVVQKAFNKLCNSHWCTYAKEALERVGVNMDDYMGEDLTQLAKTDPAKYQLLINGIQKLKAPEYRQLPPMLTA